jgi:hypothetical protein
MSREQLLAACKAHPPQSPEWVTAVRALGAASGNGFMPPGSQRPRKNWQVVLTGILRSHHFTQDERTAYLERVKYEYGSEVLYKQITQTVSQREKAERAAKKATQAATSSPPTGHTT